MNDSDVRQFNDLILRSLTSDDEFYRCQALALDKEYLVKLGLIHGLPWPPPSISIDRSRLVAEIDGFPIYRDDCITNRDARDIWKERLLKAWENEGVFEAVPEQTPKFELDPVAVPGVAVSDRPVVWKLPSRVVDRS